MQTAGGDLSKLVASFPGLFVQSIDGTDFVGSYKAMTAAVKYARARKGPALVHAKVIRPYSHSLSDDEKLYKTADERAAEAKRDPIIKLATLIVADGVATEAELKDIVKEVEAEVNAAADAAIKAEKPARDTVTRYVFSPDVDPTSAGSSAPTRNPPAASPTPWCRRSTARSKDEMARDPRIVVFGEDVADCSREASLESVPGKGGVFKVTHGLQRAFGSTRVFNSPLAEANIIGRAVGMAVRGIKPVVEIQFFDYIWPAMMQMRDEMSMLRYRSNNAFSCPMVIRTAIGGYLRGGAPYHSQSGESIFAHCPGIRIVFPSNAQDAAGLLRTAIRCDDPVLYLEHKHLYRQTYNKGEYLGAEYMVPFGKAAVRREGTDVVVLTWGALVQRSLLAAQQAEKDGISVMVIDLRSIMPFDWEAIVAAVRKTNRVVIAHEDQLTCGFGAELAARIADELFEDLDAPVRRVAALDTPVAYYPDLEEAILPQSDDVLKADHGTSRVTEGRLRELLALSGHRLWCRARVRLSSCAPAPASLLPVEILRSTGGLPAHIAGSFQRPIGFQQADNGQYFVFDRRAHAVYTIAGDTVKKIIEVGAEAGRVLDPSAFDIDPADGSFVIGDAPFEGARIQTFTATGARLGGFSLPGRHVPRVTMDSFVLSGVGSIQFTGATILINQPEQGSLITELAFDGTPRRAIGELRATGQADPNVHLALNGGFPLVDPTGGFYFVFSAGVPMFRKYDARGRLLFERHLEGAGSGRVPPHHADGLADARSGRDRAADRSGGDPGGRPSIGRGVSGSR